MKRLRTLKNLSWSQIGAFQYCKLGWYKHYIQKLWPEEKPQPLSFGIAFHAGIETFLKEYFTDGAIAAVATDNACSRLDYAYTFGREKGPNPKKWLPIGNTMVRSTIALILKKGLDPVSTEQYIARNKFSGRVDCLGLVDGERILIDWKTASKPFTQRKVDNDGQLTGYGYLLPGKWDKMAFVVAIKGTSEVHWYETTRTQEQIDAFVRMVAATRMKMEGDNKFVGVHKHNQCKWCDLQPYHCAGSGDF